MFCLFALFCVFVFNMVHSVDMKMIPAAVLTFYQYWIYKSLLLICAWLLLWFLIICVCLKKGESLLFPVSNLISLCIMSI